MNFRPINLQTNTGKLTDQTVVSTTVNGVIIPIEMDTYTRNDGSTYTVALDTVIDASYYPGLNAQIDTQIAALEAQKAKNTALEAQRAVIVTS